MDNQTKTKVSIEGQEYKIKSEYKDKSFTLRFDDIK